MSKALRDKGGNLIVIVELDENLTIPTGIANGINALNCGLIFESQIDIDTKIEKFKAEDGRTYSQEETYEGKTSGVLMETSKKIADYLVFGVRDKIHLEIKYEGIKGGKHQEIFKVADVTPQLHFKTPGGTSAMKYESFAVVKDQEVFFSEADLEAIETALGVTIHAPGPVSIQPGFEHAIIETDLA
jgi:hypothetical protein